MSLSGNGGMQNAKNSCHQIGIAIVRLSVEALTLRNKKKKCAGIIKASLKITRLDEGVYSKL